MTARLEAARTIAIEAGRILMGHHGRLAGYDEKSPIDLVTIADRESEAFISRALREAFPDDPQILEESGGRAGAIERRQAELAWCVDPLDGTTNFVHGYPFFAVSIGLLQRGRPVLGVIHAPALRETFVGGHHHPATLNGAPIHVSKVSTVSRALLATGFPYDRRERLDELLASIRRALMAAHDLRRAGSAALDLCSVAAGRIDGYFEVNLAPWDLAAGAAILDAAGGKLTGGKGQPFDIYGPRVIATNGLIHDAVEEIA